MIKFPFQAMDPAALDFQHIEDLSTAYWYSEVLFTAIRLKLFMFIDQGCADLKALAKAAQCDETKLLRFLAVLKRLGLIHEIENGWCNSQAAGIYLVPKNESYMGDFFLYRRYMKSNWENLFKSLQEKRGDPPAQVSDEENYKTRIFDYVRAMDSLAKQKVNEIIHILAEESWEPPVLDVGGGAGALGRSLVQTKKDGYGVLFEIADVIEAARILYPEKTAWGRVGTIEGDFRNYQFGSGQSFGLILLSNILHAYSEKEAEEILQKALSILKDDGILVIHDYFPDRHGRSPQKGPLYDLNMMLNTYNGVCHKSSILSGLLFQYGMARIDTIDLNTDSAIIIAKKTDTLKRRKSGLDAWVYNALDCGLSGAVLITSDKIVTGPWVREKCRFGCAKYNTNLQCPPHGMESDATQKMINSYQHALLVEGTPPGKQFHNMLLALETKAFLHGFHKAFVFGAGHCPVCDKCPEDGNCRFPDKARPSMEGSGIDVYATAKNSGIALNPVSAKGLYVKYIGLLLLE